MLSATRLRDKLREFCDPDYSAFRGFPPSKDAARQEWAAAFFDYFDQVQEDITPPVPANHPSLSTGNVQSAFFGDLGLDPTISADAAAADFAGAWRQGVLAVTSGGTVTDGASNAYVFGSWTNAATLYTPLYNTLKNLFSSPTTNALQRLTEIANAFHTASDGLMAAVTITNSSGVSSPGSMGVV